MDKVFKTDNLGLFGYLVLCGLEYVDKEVVVLGRKVKVYFVFKDDEGKGEKLSLKFNQSEFKQYRDLTLHARTEIESAKREAGLD